ncbi:MAG: hypothetical protein ABS99_00810 [Acetobacteraceae bacterium SCN 69-10]|nr:MAG: hypothetical protein ABS99_00810 [Acetobacteraceae bacterium SCN 69-10]
MISMTVQRDPSDPRVLLVAGGDASERDWWITGEMQAHAGAGRTTARIHGGVRVDDPSDTRPEAEIRADPTFAAIYVEYD